MIKVADVDQHYEHVQQSEACILHPPETDPFGERQYTAEDLGSHVWMFIQSIADVPPGVWGDQLLEIL